MEVFVGGLPPDTREEQVQQAFSAVGQVISLRLNRRKRTGECKGFGFVRYNDQATAERACAEVQEVHFPVDHVVSEALRDLRAFLRVTLRLTRQPTTLDRNSCLLSRGLCCRFVASQ